jgi:hypothetical protein
MSFRIAAVLVSSSCLAACTGARGDLRTAPAPDKQLSGRVAIPLDYAGAPDDFCDGLDIRARVQGVPVGHVVVGGTESQCTYWGSGFPVNTEVHFEIQAQHPLPCQGAGLVDLGPQDVRITFARGDSRSLDFDARCGG